MALIFDADESSRIIAPDGGVIQGARASFTPGVSYKIGDVVSVERARSQSAIWWDRIRQWRWDVPMKEPRYFKVASTAAGSIWPEVPPNAAGADLSASSPRTS